MSRLAQFEKMLAAGNDSALLRFSLGSELLNAGNAAAAVEHLRAAVAADPSYSAAWKQLGKALVRIDDRKGAMAAFEQGIAAATAKGDQQAMREMTVFLKRLLNNGAENR